MTLDDFLEIGRLRNRMAGYRRKLDAAIQLCAEELQKHKSPYVSVSGGKDSVAMAYVVEEAAQQTGKTYRMWCHISDASFPGTRETVEALCERLNRPLDLFECPYSAFEAVKDDQRAIFGKTGAFYTSIREYAQDKDLAFVGVRASESARRLRAAKIKGQSFFSKSMGSVTVCNPLLWFRLEDVAATIAYYNAPIHPIYGKQALENVRNINDEEHWIRLSYVTSRDLMNMGTVMFIRANYPELYNKLAEACPDVRNYG